MDGWLDLATFAEKYSVSQSTLRRRIRTKSIAFKLEKGKYLLEDSRETLDAAPLYSRGHSAPTTVKPTAAPIVRAVPPPIEEDFAEEEAELPSPAPRQTLRVSGFDANELLKPENLKDPVQEFLSLSDLLPITFRSEYERVVEENRRLVREIADLQTLVKAYEAELI
jgi:hypothetical protein